MRIKYWKKIYHINTNQKEGGIAVLILDIVDFKERSNTKNERNCVNSDKMSILTRISNNRKRFTHGNTKCSKQKLTEVRREMDNLIVTVRDFSRALPLC